jgi:hypothetical protein
MSISFPWNVVVRRADPERDRELTREEIYKFSNNRVFRADRRRTGIFSPRVVSNARPPALIGVAIAGGVAECYPGEWIGGPDPVVTFQWQANGADIPGETGSKLALFVADVGESIRCGVTASNATGPSVTLYTPAVIVRNP